jgi:hypothetical protein
MTSLSQWAPPLERRLAVALFLAVTACVAPNPSESSPRVSHDQLLKEAKNEYRYDNAVGAEPGNPGEIGKFDAVTGVTMKVAAATKISGPNRSRQVVARFDVDGGDYLRMGMHRGANYVFLEHNNEHGKGAILTRAYFVVPENSSEIRYLIVDRRLDLTHGASFHGPRVLTADPNQAFVYGGCVEGSFCPNGHCSVTDAGDVY